MNPGSCGGGQTCGSEHPGQGGGGPHSTPEFDGSAGLSAVALVVAVSVLVYRRMMR